MKLPLELSKFRLEGRKATMHEEVSGTPVSRVVAPKRVWGQRVLGVSWTGRCEKIDLETWSNFGL
jgi:hypothetical protein